MKFEKDIKFRYLQTPNKLIFLIKKNQYEIIKMNIDFSKISKTEIQKSNR